ncbi:hypothetical protein T492DRAFT_845802 [Pavlovales sp. CCMP2436]|nr:hypothetical protein T492DRAFT_845802 [Pavlovales sp. CCMP2436]
MRASFGCLALLALAAVGVVDVSAGVNISADECKPCGSSTCFSRLCRAGVCGTAFVTSKFVASGYIVNMPSPCEEGRYTCAEDPDDASLVCNRGACAFSAPCAPPRRGDVRLQSTELADLLELRLGQTPSAPPSGLLMVYGLGEKDRWSLACADASQARERAADVVCRQLGYSRAASAKMVQILPLLDRLKAALGGAGSTSDGIAAFGSEIKNLYGPVFGRISGSATFNMRACTSARELADEAIAAAMGVGSTPSPSSGGHGGRKLTEAEEPPRTLANCTGASLVVRACSRTNALHVSCAPEPLPPDPLPKQQHGDRALPQQHPTMACGTSGVSKLRPCAGPKAASASLGPGSALESIVPGGGRVCPPLFLPSPSVVGGGEYCVHYPHHASVSPEQRERSFRARVAAGLARGASSAPLPADSEAAADEESMRACEEAVSTGDFGATMDRCAAASGFVHPAAAAALAQAYANGENDAAAKAAAEAAGIEGLNALLAASTPPPADPLAGVTLPPVVCFLGKVEHASAADSWDSSGLLQVAGASPNAGNVTACEAFDTRVHCPSDRWAAVLLPSGSFLCAGTAPPPPPPPPRLPADVKSAAGVFPGAPAPFVLCHQTGPNPLSVAACEPRQEPTVPEEASSPIGIHLDPRPTARPPGANGLVEEEGSDDDCAFVLPSKVTEQGLSPAGCARSPLQPVLCAGGVFCPNLFRREVCPQGTFCWQGAVEPAPCSADLLGGVVGGTLFGSLFEPLLGAAPSGSSSACRPGTNRCL